jgi:hypothetical protein
MGVAPGRLSSTYALMTRMVSGVTPDGPVGDTPDEIRPLSLLYRVGGYGKMSLA